MPDQYVKLADSHGGFSDPDSPFRISRTEVKLLPDPPSQTIKDWLNAGGLVFCNLPDGEVSPDGESDVSDETEVQEESDTEEKTTVKRGRGRPKK